MYLSFIYNSEFSIKPLVLQSFSRVIEDYDFKIYEGSDMDLLGNYIYDRYFVTLSNHRCNIIMGFGLDSQYDVSRNFVLKYFPTDKPSLQFNSDDLISFRREPIDIINRYKIENENWDNEHLFVNALKREAEHSLKYRKEILSGDFFSWRMNYLLSKYGAFDQIPPHEHIELT